MQSYSEGTAGGMRIRYRITSFGGSSRQEESEVDDVAPVSAPRGLQVCATATWQRVLQPVVGRRRVLRRIPEQLEGCHDRPPVNGRSPVNVAESICSRYICDGRGSCVASRSSLA